MHGFVAVGTFNTSRHTLQSISSGISTGSLDLFFELLFLPELNFWSPGLELFFIPPGTNYGEFKLN
jgi:hypothetical protein